MRVFIAVIVLIFSLQSWTKADDISEFEIEGMSIGDSLLDYFTEEEINNKKKIYYKKKYVAIAFGYIPFFEVYEVVQFTLKPNDKKFKIYSVEGFIYFKNNIKACFREQDKIVKELLSLFKNTPMDKATEPHGYDTSGETMSTDATFYLNDGGSVRVICTDWSEKLEKKNNWKDVLKVIINSKEFSNFLSNEAY